eukprot:UN02950
MAARLKSIRHQFTGDEITCLLEGMFLNEVHDQDLIDKLVERLNILAFRNEIKPDQLFNCTYHLVCCLNQIEKGNINYIKEIASITINRAKEHVNDLDSKDVNNLYLTNLYRKKIRKINQKE